MRGRSLAGEACVELRKRFSRICSLFDYALRGMGHQEIIITVGKEMLTWSFVIVSQKITLGTEFRRSRGEACQNISRPVRKLLE